MLSTNWPFRTAQAFEDFRPVYQTYLEAVQRAGS